MSRLSAFLFANRLRVLAAVAVVSVALGAGITSRLGPFSANDAATQSVQASNRYEAATGRQVDPGIIALVRSADVARAAARARVQRVASELRGQPGIAAVTTYCQTRNRAMVSGDGRSTYLLAYFRPLTPLTVQNDALTIVDRFKGQHDVELGGVAVANAQVDRETSTDLVRAELFAFPLIFLLSLLFFRSLVASVLPPLVGGLAIAGTLLALRVIDSFVDLSVYALNVTTGLGRGLAIDYSLFVVSRYREEQPQGV